MTEPLVGLAYVGMLFSPVLVSMFGFKGERGTSESALDGREELTIPPSRVSSELRTSLATDAPESIALEVRAKRRSDEGDPVSKAGAVQKGRDRAKLEQASGVLFNPVLTGLVPQHSL